jgi:hypothetical protein
MIGQDQAAAFFEQMKITGENVARLQRESAEMTQRLQEIELALANLLSKQK